MLFVIFPVYMPFCLGNQTSGNFHSLFHDLWERNKYLDPKPLKTLLTAVHLLSLAVDQITYQNTLLCTLWVTCYQDDHTIKYASVRCGFKRPAVSFTWKRSKMCLQQILQCGNNITMRTAFMFKYRCIFMFWKLLAYVCSVMAHIDLLQLDQTFTVEGNQL